MSTIRTEKIKVGLRANEWENISITTPISSDALGRTLAVKTNAAIDVPILITSGVDISVSEYIAGHDVSTFYTSSPSTSRVGDLVVFSHTSDLGIDQTTISIKASDIVRWNPNVTSSSSDVGNILVFSDSSGKVIETSAYTPQSFIPSGLIIMWYGASENVPSGWLVCDGSLGTPDLRDRFVVGAGSTYSVGDTGGESSVTLTSVNIPSHTHVVPSDYTYSDGAHNHGGSFLPMSLHSHYHMVSDRYVTYTTDSFIVGTTGSTDVYLTGFTMLTADYTSGSTTAPVHTHSVPPTTETAGSNHTHTFSGNSSYSGSGVAHENIPPYYALLYLMKS